MREKFWFLDKHHKIERFGILFFSLSFLMLVTIASIFIKKHGDDKEFLSDTVMYTAEFRSSLSDAEGVVSNIYKSMDGTKVFVLLQFENVSNMSLDAKDYQVFLTGSDTRQNPVDLLSSPSGSIYMFGSSGYMGIYLVDSAGFPSQIVDMVVRCNTVLAESGETSEEASVDASFSKYDQFRVYFNPGGVDAPTVACLNEEKMTPNDIYEDMVIRVQEDEIRATLTASLTNMQASLRKVEEYTKRLDGLGIDTKLTPMPEPIRDTTAKSFTTKTASDGETEVVYYNPSHVLAGGFDFNWQDGSIKEGYLDDLVKGMTVQEYLDAKSREVDAISTTSAINNVVWYYKGTGSVFAPNAASELTSVQQINNAITDLTGAWTEYYNLKKQYQCTDLRSLLLLEERSEAIASNYTVNAEADVVTLY